MPNKVELIYGPMKSDKTSEMIARINHSVRYGKKNFLIFKPETDNRNSKNMVHTYNGDITLPAIEIPSDKPELILEIVKDQTNINVDIIGFSEIQFFNFGICTVVHELRLMKKRIIMEGLLLDHQGRNFGPTTTLLNMSTRKDECFAICECHHSSHENGVCGSCARFSALRPDIKIKDGQIIFIGRDDFVVMCAKCFYGHLQNRYIEPSMREFFLKKELQLV